MKTLLLSTALAAGLVLPVVAQEPPVSPFQTEASGPSVPASDMIGARIYASEAAIEGDAFTGVQEGWNDIGEVNDVILGRDGMVDAVLVDIGGFLGIGERQIAVDMAALRFVQDDATDADDWFLVLQADRATLEGAPEWTLTTDRADVDAATDAAKMTEAPLTEGTNPPVAEGKMALPEGYATVEHNALTAEMLTGANVRDASDATIAEVADLVLTPEGEVTHVVLDVGGFLGIGAKSVALPMEDLTVAQSGETVGVWVNMTKDELKALPEHKM